MQKLSKREVVLLAIFFFLLLLYAGVRYIYEPLSLQIRELTVERELLAEKWQEIEGWTEREAQLSEQTGKLKEELKQYERAFLINGQTSTFWHSIHQTAQQSGIKIVRIQEGEDKRAAGREGPFLIEIEGGYSSVQQFLRILGKLPYQFAVSHGEFTMQGSAVHTTITLQWGGKNTN